MNTQIINGHEYKLVLSKNHCLPSCAGCAFLKNRYCEFPGKFFEKACTSPIWRSSIYTFYYIYIKSWD